MTNEWRVERTETKHQGDFHDEPEVFIHWRVFGPTLLLGSLTFVTEAQATAAATYLNALNDAKTALEAARKELTDAQENHCTCLHDYFDGDHHYQWCPGNDAAKKASSQLWISHNRISYHLDKALSRISPETVNGGE